MLLGLSDYHDSIHYHDSLGLFMNKIVSLVGNLLVQLSQLRDKTVLICGYKVFMTTF